MGRFTGLDPATQDVPELVVHGSGETHRLPPLPDGEPWPPGNGEPWRATFGWDEAPTAVESAELQIGELELSLPQPGSETAAAPAMPAPSSSSGAADRLREQADLVLAREELSKARTARDAALEELAHVKEQLEEERRARVADSERFREDIEALRATAEDTIAAEREAAGSLGDDLAAAREEGERVAARAAILAEERDAALARIEPLEAAARELEDLHATFERVSERLQAIRATTDGG